MKEVLAEAGVPTARFGVFTEAGPAKAFLRSLPGPWVVKTDGLAAGKGVLVTGSLPEAEADVDAKLSGDAFGDAGRRVVVEEGLDGPGVLAAGPVRRPTAGRAGPGPGLQAASTIGDGGPNTGGMGAYSPVPGVDDGVGRPAGGQGGGTAGRRAASGAGSTTGACSTPGLMLTPDGPKVLEFNVRFGDPETQVVLPRLDGDLAALLAEAASGSLRTRPRFTGDAAVCVVLASEGYPEVPADRGPHRGSRRRRAGWRGSPSSTPARRRPTRAGCGRGGDVGGPGARRDRARPDPRGGPLRAYRGVAAISWPGAHVRTDIARDAAVAGGADRPVASAVQQGVR